VLRVVLGLIFFAHGLAKLQTGLGQVAVWFESVGLPAALAYVVAYVELAGGVAMMIGFATRYVAGIFALLMLGAIFAVKLPNGLLSA
ncbi:DoxX family protein, partial [Frankia sp. Cpl3]|nr:DoxX family protein [Frankia sp. Cpl3]